MLYWWVNMVKKGVLLACLMFLIISITVSASTFTVSTQKIKDGITLDEVAEFDLTIFNNMSTTQQYRLVKLDYPYWDYYTKSRESLIFNIGPNQSKTINLFVDPLHVASLGTVDVNLKIKRTESDEEKIISLRVAILSSGSVVGGYVPTVVSNLNIPKEIDPKQEIPLKINLNNQNPLEYDEIIISIKSNTINQEIKTDLGAKEKKDVELNLRINANTKPQDDTITLTLLNRDRVIDGPKSIKFSIISYTDIVENVVASGNLLNVQKDITFTNDGNDIYKGEVAVETNLFKSWFTFSSPKGEIVDDGGKRKVRWNVEIDPGSSVSVRLNENYLVLLAAIILLIIGGTAYCLSRSPLIVTKRADNIVRNDGGISEFKIIITVKNRGKTPLRDISVIDTIPNIANIEKELSIGTLQPVRVLKHAKRGSLIKWIIDDLGLVEERVITYRIKSILPILGDFNLPSAKVTLLINNKKKVVRSNSLNIAS
ncbi:MAG: hypothetical protein ABIJ08_02360 [Nanoarchaeota archaeon]